MSRRFVYVVPVLLAALSALAAPDTREEWQAAWRQRFAVHEITVDDTNPGRRTFYVNGELSPPGKSGDRSATDDDATIRAFVDSARDLLGIGDVLHDLRAARHVTDEHGRVHVLYDEVFRDIVVRETQFSVHLDASGAVYAINGSAALKRGQWVADVQSALRDAKVSEADARATAEKDAISRSSVPATVERTTAEKRILTAEPFVVWEIDVILRGGGRWQYDIDGVTSNIVSVRAAIEPQHPETDERPAAPAGDRIEAAHATLDPALLRPASGKERTDAKPAATAQPADGSRHASTMATQTVLSETFEGSFPSGSWSVYDDNGSTSGEVYWDDTSYRAHTGSWSAWCADGGANAVGAGGTYPANMNTWMVWGPFSLADANAGTLSMAQWIKTESNYDFLRYYVSIDHYNYYGYARSGDTAGWSSGSIDFTNVPTLGNITGQGNVWIGINFISDGSVGYEGAYVDDIVVQKQTVSGADLSLQTVDALTGSVKAGDWLTIRNSTTNIGGATSTTYRITFYASTNTTISTSDTALGYADRTALAAGATHAYDNTVQIPSSLAAGTYYIGAILTVTDASSANNTNYDSTAITVTSATSGPSIGVGYGVLGEFQNHIDTWYDTTLLNEYLLRDVTRRANTNPHGHNGQMTSSAVIETQWVTWTGSVETGNDLNDTWDWSSDASGVDQQVYTGLVYDYLDHGLSLNGYDAAGSSMWSLVDLPGSMNATCPNNAFWDGSRVNICEGSGMAAYSGALDVVAHEWGHAVTEKAPIGRTGRLVYEKESGALNEAFSDWMGAAAEHWYGETNWTHGEGVRVDRDLANPPAHNQPDTYGAGPYWVPTTSCTPALANDWCGVHTNSGVGNKMFYLLSQGGTFNGVTVTGLGVQTAMAVALDANRYHWSATTTYAGARQGMIDSAAAWGSNAVTQVTAAWTAVGVGTLPCTSFQISPTSANPGSASGSTSVTVTGTSPSGCTGGSWTTSGNGSWLTVTPASSSGSTATVSWTQNSSSSSRSANATIAGHTFAVNQSGSTPPACTTFTVSPAALWPGSASGSQAVTITGTGPAGCSGGNWTASGNGSWLTVSATSGSSGSVTLYWTQNTSSSSRTGNAVIAGNTVPVTQAGTTVPTCTGFTISPSSTSPSFSPGSVDVAVSGSPSGCQGGTWTTSGNGSWITVSPAGSSGSGWATVSWTENTSASARSGNATIAGNSFVVNQGAAAAVHGLVPLTPCRLFDSRDPNGTHGGPALTSNSVRNIAAVGYCSIPADATALAVNLTAVAAPANGWLTLYAGPSGTSLPSASTLLYGIGKTRGNFTIVPVGSDGSVNLYNSGPGGINAVLDVTAYFK